MKRTVSLLTAVVSLIFMALFFNIRVSTKQCIDYDCRYLKIPLYLKVMDFFDRHYNYAWLAGRIIAKKDSGESRALKILDWTYQNIKRQPAGLPVVDDHVWHIIVRGYGAADQFSDVFTTLCNYAGLDAFFISVYSRDSSKRIPLSFVKINKKWRLFDPYRGVYFRDKDGALADLRSLKENKGYGIGLTGRTIDIDYSPYFPGLPLVKEAGLRRANIQSPLRRLLYEFARRISKDVSKDE